MRYEERRGGESYRPSNRHSRSRSRSRIRRPRSPPRNRSPRLGADTWVPRGGHPSERYRSRSPANFHRSRSPSYRQPQRARSPVRPRSPRRDRPRSPIRSSWRSRSPFGPRPHIEHQPSRGVGDNFRASHIPRSPRRERQPSPPPDRYRDPSPPLRSTFKERESSYGRPAARSRSPYRGGRSPRDDPIQNRRTLSPVKRTSSGHTSALNSASTSRRSSPPITHERFRVPSSGPRSRSPALDTSSRRNTNDGVAKPTTVSSSSPGHGKYMNTSNTMVDQASAGTTDRPRIDRDDGPKDSRSNTSRNSQEAIPPTAPGATSLPSTSSSSQNQPSNMSLLSAPTRPRGAAGYTGRDPTWSGSSTPRRAPPLAQQGPPTGPRNRYVYSPPVHDLHRTPSYRQNNGVSINHQRSTRPNYLATLPTIVSGGRLLPWAFDFAIEKRLMNLKADEEKLAEQVLEKQHLKRTGLRDWERLQRESALNALRSELAEVHLQRMTEEDRLEGSNAF